MPADLVYYYIPKEAAVTVSAISHLYAGFLGIVTLDFINHLAFDWKLARSEGWKTPAKAVVRIAYFNCRIFSIVVLSMTLAFTTEPIGRHIDCNRYLSITQWMIVPLLNSASLIFVIRTISLYGSKRSVAIPIIIAWLIVFASSLSTLPFWGTAFKIPGTDFCTYDARRDRLARVPLNVLYKALNLLLNTTVLLLTLHRLMENGISGLWRRRQTIGVTPLPKVLISQGFFYFVVAIVVDVTFMVLYFTQPSTNPGLQVAGTALVFSIQPMVAARLYRTVGKAVNTRHVPAINPTSFGSIPSSTAASSGANSMLKVKSFGDPCSCKHLTDDRAFSLNATPPGSAYGSTRTIQHENGCSRRAPRSSILPMHAIPRRPVPAAVRNSSDNDDGSPDVSPFEPHLGFPLPSEETNTPDTGIHVRTDTVSEVSVEDVAANSTFYTGYTASSQLEHAAEAERRWPRLAAAVPNRSIASLTETLAEPKIDHAP